MILWLFTSIMILIPLRLSPSRTKPVRWIGFLFFFLSFLRLLIFIFLLNLHESKTHVWGRKCRKEKLLTNCVASFHVISINARVHVHISCISFFVGVLDTVLTCVTILDVYFLLFLFLFFIFLVAYVWKHVYLYLYVYACVCSFYFIIFMGDCLAYVLNEWP